MSGSFKVTSELHASAATLWAAVGTMEGVNDELRPWFHMTAPREAAAFRIEDAPTGALVFRSWLLFAGVLPIDLHSLGFARIDAGRGFDEDSTSWMQARWQHHRHIEPIDEGRCRLTDRLEWEPRTALAGPVVAWLVPRLFRHRHRRLQKRYGGDFAIDS